MPLTYFRPTKMLAFHGKAVFEGDYPHTEQGVADFREAVLEASFVEVPEVGEAVKHTLLISIPGGKA